jgi:hypothetical protein
MTTYGELSTGDTARVWGAPTVLTLVEPYGDQPAVRVEWVDGGGFRHRTRRTASDPVARWSHPL